LCRTMSSYTPFITENIYQGLRPYIPASAFPNEDIRSVHFLSFPLVRDEYFDAEIERKVKRMQNVIELARTLRERHTLPLKTPLKSLLVFHQDQQYHDDVKLLQPYLESELNIREINFSSDEERSGVRYRANADWAILGRKLRKELGRVKAGLPLLSSDDVKGYVQNGVVTVDGIELVAGDLTVIRYIELPTDGTLATNTDNDVVIVLDVQIHPELESEGLAREIINRVQKLRKKAGLQATDDVRLFYKFESGIGEVLREVMTSHAEIISKTVRSVPEEESKKPEGTKVLIAEEQEIGETKFILSLVPV